MNPHLPKKTFSGPKKAAGDRGFTMIEIMIVIAIIGIVVAIAQTTYVLQREVARSRRCQENLSKIDGAKENFVLDNNLGEGAPAPDMNAVLVGPTNYIKSTPICPADGNYTVNAIGTDPTCDYEEPAWLQAHLQHEIP